MRFAKVHGTDIDFLLCDRRFGVGANGVIFLFASSAATVTDFSGEVKL